MEACRRPSTTLATPSFKSLADACACIPTEVFLTRPLVLGNAHNNSNADVPTVSLFSYDIGRELGCGSFSTVRQATCKHGSVQAAVKKVHKGTTSAQLVPTEVKVLQRVQGHPNVLNLVSTCEDNENVYLVTTFCANGSLFDYLCDHGAVTERRARFWCRQLVDAVDHCQRQGVVHRDIKLENTYLDASMNVVLGDFGLGVVLDNPHTCRLSTPTGSPVFAAPEVYSARKTPYTAAPADMWSVGVVLHCMLTGSLPFDRDDYKSEWHTYTPPAHLSAPARDLLSRLLCVDPTRRISAADALEHPWLEGANYNPALHPHKSA